MEVFFISLNIDESSIYNEKTFASHCYFNINKKSK